MPGRLAMLAGMYFARISIAFALFLAIIGGPEIARAQESRPQEARHVPALALHGAPALAPDFTHLPYANPEAPKGGALRYGIEGSFDSLNVLIYRGNSPPVLVPYLLQPLMMRSGDEPFTVYALIAKSIAVPEDRSFVEFRIDERARFSDGKPVTARDVQFSWSLYSTKGRHLETARRIASVTLPDAMTIRFTFKVKGERELPLILALMPVMAEHATDPAAFENPGFSPFLGSGPYLIEELVPGTRIVLRRRADYWAKDLPIHRGLYNFETIGLEFFRDSNAMFEAFKTGLLDYRLESDPTKWREGYDFPAVKDGRVALDSIPIGAPKGMSGFIFNTRRPLFADSRVREAFFHLFDFEWVNRNLFDGIYRRTGSFFDESELAFRGHAVSARETALLGAALESLPPAIRDGSWRPPATDGSGRDRAVIRRAIELLKAAGYQIREGRMVSVATGEPLAFEIMVTSRAKERLALAFADGLKQVGIVPAIRFVDSSQYWARLRQFSFDMIIEGFPVSPSPGQEQANRFSSRAAERQGSLNWAGVRSEAVDRATAAIIAAESREEYLAAVRALDRLLIAGHYVLPLYHLPDRWLARWKRIARPARIATYDIPIDSFWFDPNQ